ncbi:protein kinase [Pseudoneurospora amorphoporcata]|uniref:Protein kinase n=1 Tax=Pseudoneurospora amorphoporcata TaxID=241081 RepID=A0AAN6SHQ3_9PEZI|nr:protein kinase [Pseudoneurospora amorphoporcata]
MQTAKGKAEALGRKAKLASSYQELLDEFSSKDLRSVGNYTLGRLIGKGSFGKVYLATHKLTNGSKVVLKSANKDDTNLAREIHHHRQFVHPHIARLYEVVVTENLVWMVLEYCPGDELYNYLLQHGKLSVDKVQRIFAQLVGAVCYVHRQSCVHRDLKLENILLDKHENVKLCDFGFTREYEGKANYLQTFCGTICYSAPEMLKGEKYAGEKVDVWSLGVILYALLCGELPFDDDDEQVTRRKILSEEPDYPDTLPADALSLMKKLLSKRPLIRPSLPDILAHPFLAEYAPQQQEILKIEQPPPFSTSLEKETLHRMRSAGVDTEAVMESVIAQRCDALAGWWTLLIEKEERKAARRERKRKEKEENRNSRRFSQASSRLNALATVEESQFPFGEQPQRPRGRSERRRSGPYPTVLIPDMPSYADCPRSATEPRSPVEGDVPPPPLDKDSIRGRSTSSSRHRKPIPPPKEGILRSARSRGSTLHLVTTSEVLDLNGSLQLPDDQNQVKKRPSKTKIFWKNWTHWLFESTRRHKNSHKRASQSTPNLADKDAVQSVKEGKSKDGESIRPQTSKYPAASSPITTGTAGLPKSVVANGYANKASPALSASSAPFKNSNATAGLSSSLPSSLPPIPRTYTSGSHKRQSLSPSPLTPRSTMRRASGTAGLRGRKSTSSSVSSIRSMHHTHHHSHSKASSTSSNNSVSTSVSKSALQASRSPHHSVKVLPATPTAAGGFPSNIRYVRDRTGPPLGIGSLGGPGLFASPSEYSSSDNGRLNAPFLGNGGGGLSAINTNTQYYPLPQAPGSPNPFASVNSGGYFAPRAAGTGSPVVGPGGHGGVMFAKRKKNLFKGPMLNFGGSAGGAGAGSSRQREERGGNGASGSASASHSRSASASGLGRGSGEITIQEEEEPGEEEEEEHHGGGGYGYGGGYNSHGWSGSRTGAGWGGPGMAGMEEEEEVEEVDRFSPIIGGPGEIVEERIIEDGDEDEEADESADEGTITDQRSRRSRPRSQDLDEEEEVVHAVGDIRPNANPNQTPTRPNIHQVEEEEEVEDNVDVGEGFKGLGYDVGVAITTDSHRLSTDGMPLSSSTVRVVPEQHQQHQQHGRGHRRGWSNGGSGGGGNGEGTSSSPTTTKVSR